MKFDHHALMHGKDYDGRDLTGWLAQEKFDGFRAFWNGFELRSRQGEKFAAPQWFFDGLPSTPLDGELYLGRGRLSELNAMVWNPESPLWKEALFVIFDAPTAEGGIVDRLLSIGALPLTAAIGPIFKVSASISEQLTALLITGGEGYMLRDPNAPYKRGRTDRLLKLNSVHNLPASFASSSLM
jgi:DNA ligase-1